MLKTNPYAHNLFGCGLILALLVAERADVRFDLGSSLGVEVTCCIHDTFCTVSKANSCSLQSYEGMRYFFYDKSNKSKVSVCPVIQCGIMDTNSTELKVFHRLKQAARQTT